MNWQIPLPSFSGAQPEIFLTICILLLTLIGVFLKKNSFKIVYIGAIASVLMTFVLAVKGNIQAHTATTETITFNGLFINDAFAVYVKFVLTLGTALILLMIRSALTQLSLDRFEYPILMLTSTLGLMLMVSANDFMSLFVGIELLSLSIYVLIAMQRKNMQASEASLKYFILSALATGLFLYGVSWIYGYTGTTNYAVIERFLTAHNDSHMTYLTVGYILAMCGICFKLAAAPFHMWAPDVYQGTPTPSLTYFATLPKFVFVCAIVRIATGPFHLAMPQLSIVFLLLAVTSMVIGSFATLTQTSLKRFIAYSSIGQVGFALIGLYLSTEESYRVTLLFVLYYVITMLGFMACLIHLSKKGNQLSDLQDLNGLSKHHPLVTFCMGFFILSFIGIPPMPGFLPKLMMIQAAIQHGHYFLAVVAVLYNVVAAAYYLLFLKAIYIDQGAETQHSTRSLKTSEYESLAIAYLLIALLVALVVHPTPLITLCSRIVSSLMYF